MRNRIAVDGKKPPRPHPRKTCLSAGRGRDGVAKAAVTSLERDARMT